MQESGSTSREVIVTRYAKYATLALCGATLLQFGGCLNNALVDVIFAVAPLVL